MSYVILRNGSAVSTWLQGYFMAVVTLIASGNQMRKWRFYVHHPEIIHTLSRIYTSNVKKKELSQWSQHLKQE